MGTGRRTTETTKNAPPVPAALQELITILDLSLTEEINRLKGLAQAAADAGLAHQGVVQSGVSSASRDPRAKVFLQGYGDVATWAGTVLACAQGGEMHASSLGFIQRDYLRNLARGA